MEYHMICEEKLMNIHIDGLVHYRSNSCVLAIELQQSCT